MTVGFIIGAIAGPAVGSATGKPGDGAIVGATLGTMECGLAETDCDPMTARAR